MWTCETSSGALLIKEFNILRETNASHDGYIMRDNKST